MTRLPRRRARVAGTLCFCLAAIAPFACKKPQSIGFQIDLPADVAGNVAWIEVGVFGGETCNALRPILPGGVPAGGYVKRLAWRSDATSTPSLGNLPRGKYAIGVAARAEDCSVLASGCTDVDFAQSSSVDVSLSDDSPPQGACTGGAVCDDGRCTPGTDNSNPTVGAGCSLEFLGAGPFADPLVAFGGLASAPAVVPTDTGFLIAYREYDPSGNARLTAIPIDQGGGAGPAQQAQQPACTTSPESDATGLAFLGNAGVVALGRAACAGVGGLDLFGVDDHATIGNTTFAPQAVGARLSTAHALASSSAGTFVAYVASGRANVAQASGLDLGAANPFGGPGPASDAWVATSEKVVALLAAGQASATGARPFDLDGGAEGGVEAGVDGAVPPPPIGSTLSLNVVAAGASLAALDPPFTFPGTWGSLSAQAGRVIVASDGLIPGKPVVYNAFDLGVTAPAVSDGFATAGLGKVLYSDVAFHQDHVFFAVEREGAIALVAFDHATTSPTFLREIDLGDDPRVPSIANVRDGRVAVAASDTRVVVAWTSGQSLTSNDAVGGYAVFACTTP